MAERILLAGCGDLGLRVAARLVAAGDEVWALRRHVPREAPHEWHWLEADLSVPATLANLPRGITRVVYLPAPDARDAGAYRALFVEGVQHLLAALDDAALQQVLLVSSSAVYGEHRDGWVDETTPPAPPGFNGALLLEAERWLMAQAVPSTVLRLAGLYGPGRLQLIERLRASAARVPRSAAHWANRIHVDDAASAIVHLLRLPAPLPVYLGVDDTPLPLDALYDHLARLTGAPLPLDGPAPAGVGSKRLRNTRLRDSGWAPAWPDARDGYAALLDT